MMETPTERQGMLEPAGLTIFVLESAKKAYVLVTVSTALIKHLDHKQLVCVVLGHYFVLQLVVHHLRKSWQELKDRSWRQELIQRPWRAAAY